MEGESKFTYILVVTGGLLRILVVTDGLLRQPIVFGSLPPLLQSRDCLVFGLKKCAHLLKNRLIGGHGSVEKCLRVELVIGVVPIKTIGDVSAPATTTSAGATEREIHH